ncbi:MAG: hypothetical protein QMD82_01400 [bacterium]|nr:hypothetical protein [bacterium]
MMADLFNLFNKTFRAYKIYPKGHEIPKYFLRQLWDNLKINISRTTKIEFIFDKGEVLDLEGKTIWKESEDDDNLAWVMYKHGIRGISITQDITATDLQNLFEAIQNAYASNDKFALIYEINLREYSGISFEFIPEFLQDQNVVVPETYQDLLKLKEKEPSSEPVEYEGPISATIEIPIIIESREVFTISFEEEQKLNEEIAKERETNHLEKVLYYLYTIIELESVEEIESLLKALEEFILLEINDSGISKVSRVIHDLKTLKIKLQSTEKARAIDLLLKRISEPSLIENMIRNHIDNRPKELELLLSGLDSNAALALFKIAAELPQKSQRQLIFRAMINMQNFEPNRILKYIVTNKKNEKILSAGLEFISVGKYSQAKEFLTELQMNIDKNLKKNLLEALSAIEGDLTPFFYDDDISVRMTTYLEMKRNPRKSFVNLIVERLKSDELFFKFDVLEKKQFLSLIPEYIDYPAVEEALRNILTQNLSLLNKITKSKKYYETLQFLINSLVESNKRKVYLLLIEAVKKTKDSKIREMCSEALKQFKE